MPSKNYGFGCQDPGDDPTPEQIRMQCRNIRRRWNEGEERLRRTGSSDSVPYEVPGVKVLHSPEKSI